MKQVLTLGVAAVAFLSLNTKALAASDEAVTEVRRIDARVVRVKLDGVIDVRLRQGPVAALTITGEPGMMSKTSSEQHGDTLVIGTETKGFRLNRGRNALRAELTLPALREVSSESVGWTEITGFTGKELELSLEGAGSMKVNCQYSLVSATLGGVGNMQILGINNDGIDLTLRGAGFVTLHGQSKWLKASMGGLGGLDARHLEVDTVDLDLSGLGNASVSARQNLTLNLSGMGSVAVYGKPLNRKVSIDGLGKVSWK